jgi:hypothetical protein
MRLQLRRESDAPNEVISMTDRENTDPSLAIPSTDTEEPTREKPRRANVDPTCAKSSTATEEPKRDSPYIAKLDPKRHIDLSESDAPK